jgi:putative transposase
VYFY